MLVKKNYHGEPKWYIQLNCPHLMHFLVLYYYNIFLFAWKSHDEDSRRQ